jgi:glycosyltransferase involved in cell wall biosynthesis
MRRIVAKRRRVTVLTNYPVPYRLPVHDLMRDHVDLTMIYEGATGADRHWQMDFERPGDVLLAPESSESALGSSLGLGRHAGLWRALRRANPDVVVVTGFGPAYVLAAWWSVVHRRKLVVHTDGTLQSEVDLTPVHRWIRRLVGLKASAFVGTGSGARALYASWGVPASRIFVSPLVVDVEVFAAAAKPHDDRGVDLLMAARLVPEKNLLFGVEVARKVGSRLGRPVRLAIAGLGPERGKLELALATAPEIESEMLGFVSSELMPSVFGDSRVLMFPTLHDPWGLVVNEALAAGCWVISSPHAGAALELVATDADRGVVEDLDLESWADAIAAEIRSPRRREVDRSGPTFADAAAGLIAACAVDST